MAEAKTEKEPPRQSRAWFAPGSITYFLYLYERPVGIGVLVGSAGGALNSLIFSIPVLASTFIGAALGGLVCIVVDPAIRAIVNIVSARRPLCRNPDAQPLRFSLH